MPRFHTQYFIITVILFVIEILIALYVNDSFIRPYLGDVLVVILIYCAIRAFFDTPVVATAMGVLAFSFLVEFCNTLILFPYLVYSTTGWQGL